MRNLLLLNGAIFGFSVLTTRAADPGYVLSPDPALASSGDPGIFLVTSSEFSSVRGQTVHASRDFTGAGGPLLLITGISYSAPSWSGRVPIDVTLPNIEIRISTTQKQPDALSPNFAENIGADQAVVYSGALHFYETETEKYDIHVPITPFLYNPAAGNLLVEIVNYAPILSRRDPDWITDQAIRNGDSVSSVAGRAIDPSGSTGTAGMMTRFTYTPVPEPSTWALLATGAIGLAITRWAAKRRKG